MRALVLKEFGRLQVEERSQPEPAADEVLIAVVATGICGSDIHGFTGENGRRQPGQVMGHETVGRIAAFGKHVGGFSIGQPVTVNPVVVPDATRPRYMGREQHAPDKYVIGVRADRDAGFAEFMVVPARNAVALSPQLPILLGALIEPLAVALHAVRRAAPTSDDRVLVIGGGPIGQSLALCLTLHTRTRVVVSEIDTDRRALLETLGVPTVDPSAGHIVDGVVEALDGEADIVLDAVGVDGSLADAFACSRLGARICLVGMGAPWLNVDAFRVSTDERAIVGSFTYSDDDFEDAAAMVSASPVQTAILLSRTVAVDDAQQAFIDAAQGAAPPGKTLVRFDLRGGAIA